ncbi:MAG: protease modulator HflC [Pseudomonadota bacterium]
MRAGLIAIVVAVVLLVVAALNSFFIVNPTQQALVLQFGEVKNAVTEPGLQAKIPFVQDVHYLDRRVLDLNVPAQEIIAADQKRLVVDAFMRYRISNPVLFYQTVNNVREGSTRLSTFATSSLRAVLADATFQDIVRDDRPELMRRISQDVARNARGIGVDVVDVKIRRADLPEANSEAIFARMQTERIQEATEIRAQGREAAQRVRAAADRTATVLRAEAQREGQQIRGQGDGQANAIFAQAYSADPQFFAFYRAMQAYESSLAANDTRLVLSPGADFFRYFNDPQGLAAPSASSDGGGLGGVTPAVSSENGAGVGGDVSSLAPSGLSEQAAEAASLTAPVEAALGALTDAELLDDVEDALPDDADAAASDTPEALDEEARAAASDTTLAEAGTEASVDVATPIVGQSDAGTVTIIRPEQSVQ